MTVPVASNGASGTHLGLGADNPNVRGHGRNVCMAVQQMEATILSSPLPDSAFHAGGFCQ
jgi:hypothetical protein